MSSTTFASDTYNSLQTESSGYCRKCKIIHRLGSNTAITSCLTLMKQLSLHGSINLFSSDKNEDEELKTDYLFGPARGKMFGVMNCTQPNGADMSLFAFSGQYNGSWKVQGWAPPLFDVDDFSGINDTIEKQIKIIGREIDLLPDHSEKWLLLRDKRRRLSQNLMRDIHSLYRLTNFHGETTPLYQAYNDQNGISTGTGDCCAPKLFNYAAKNNLTPRGIAEFYWGRQNKSASRRHGFFYSSCKEKCEPILGYMLCGLDRYGNKNIAAETPLS